MVYFGHVDAGAGQGELVVFDVITGAARAVSPTMKFPRSRVPLEFSPSGRLLAFAVSELVVLDFQAVLDHWDEFPAPAGPTPNRVGLDTTTDPEAAMMSWSGRLILAAYSRAWSNGDRDFEIERLFNELLWSYLDDVRDP